MQPSLIFHHGRRLCQLLLVLTLGLMWMPQAQAASSVQQSAYIEPSQLLINGERPSQTDITVYNTDTSGPGSLYQVLTRASPDNTITFAHDFGEKINVPTVTLDRATTITNTSQISSININIVVNPDRIDELSGLILENGLDEAALIDLLFTGIFTNGITSTVPIQVILEDLGESGAILATDTACDLITLALESQGLDEITLTLLSEAACALITDGINSVLDAVTAEVQAVLDTIGPLDENTLIDFSNTVCDLISEGISAGDIDPITADLLAEVAA